MCVCVRVWYVCLIDRYVATYLIDMLMQPLWGETLLNKSPLLAPQVASSEDSAVMIETYNLKGSQGEVGARWMMYKWDVQRSEFFGGMTWYPECREEFWWTALK